MRKYMFVLAVLTLSSVLCGVEYSFEKEVLRKKSPNVALEHKIKLSSTPSLRISNGSAVRKAVKLAPNSRYRLTFYVRGENISDGRDEKGRRCGGRFYVHNAKKWLSFTSRERNAAETGTFDWRKGEGIIDTADMGEMINLNPSIFGKGVIYFDKIRLEKIQDK